MYTHYNHCHGVTAHLQLKLLLLLLLLLAEKTGLEGRLIYNGV